MLEPTFIGWQAHARPFGFEPELEYAHGAARFLTGTPNVPALYAATAGYDLIEEIGVERIRDVSIRQTQLLIELLDEAGFDVGSPRDPRRRGGTVTVRTPEFEAVHKELAERQILCDFRPDAGLRLGPHYYNTEDELRYAVGQIVEIVETGAFSAIWGHGSVLKGSSGDRVEPILLGDEGRRRPHGPSAPACVRVSLAAHRPGRSQRASPGECPRSGAARRTARAAALHVCRLGCDQRAHTEPNVPQVQLRKDYSGRSWSAAGSCRQYDGPKLAWLVTACAAPDGSYWAVQSWRRTLPNFDGGRPRARRVGAPPLPLVR